MLNVSFITAIFGPLCRAELLSSVQLTFSTVPRLVDDVTDDEWRKEEEAVTVDGALCLNIDLMYRNNLPLRRRGLPHHLQGPHSRPLSGTRETVSV